MSMVNQISGLSCRPPQGAFYAFISCSSYMGKKTPGGKAIASDDGLVDYLLNDAGVATIPGTPFGMGPYLRVSFATSRTNIKTGLERIKDALGCLH